MVTEAPAVGTGVEHYAAKYSGEMLVADVAGTWSTWLTPRS